MKEGTEVDPPIIEPQPPAAPPRTPSAVLMVVYPALIIVLCTSVTVLFLLHQRQVREDQNRDEIERVSRDFLVALTNYDEQSFPDSRHTVLGLSTGRFRTEYEETLGAGYLRLLAETRAEARGRIVSLAVVEIDDDRAMVISVVDQIVINRDQVEPRLEMNRIELALTKTTGRWKIDSVTLL